MAYTPIPIGSLAWGTPVNNAFASQDTRISALEAGVATPSEQGLIAAPYDLATSTAASSPVSGTVHMVAMDVTAPATVSNIVAPVFTAGSGLTAGQNFAGLYNAAGTRIGVTADQTVAWASLGVKTMPITPVPITAGLYYVALLSNGTTPPGILRSLSAGALPEAANLGRTPANGRWTTGPTAQTTLPASITMASRLLSAVTFWAGIS